MPPKNDVTKDCAACGKSITRCASHMKGNVCCDAECARVYKSKRFSKMNFEMNPDRMTLETRTKLREARLNTGEGKTYTKTFGRHTHRIVMEEKLGRALLPGEIVHHIDEDKRNNHPDNLELFASASEHSRHHAKKWTIDRSKL